LGTQVRFGVVVAVLVFVLVLPAAARADQPFSVRFSTNDAGNIAIAAAPLLTCSTTGVNGAQCAAARNLDPSTAGPAGADTDSYTMVNVDTDGDPATTVNSSTARLALPAGATVLFAGLYWGADSSQGGSGGPPAAGTVTSRIKFKAPGGAYVSRFRRAPSPSGRASTAAATRASPT
jgi:hypothetical protein